MFALQLVLNHKRNNCISDLHKEGSSTWLERVCFGGVGETEGRLLSRI